MPTTPRWPRPAAPAAGGHRTLRERATRTVAAAMLAGLVVAGSVAGSSAAASATVVAEPDGLDYVALGDSFSAGFGVTPTTGLPVPGCLQAEQNFPHQVAAGLGLRLTDVTCSGATTQHVAVTSQDTGAGVAPRQLDALSADTDIVTITIGGNDLGFATIANACTAASADGPLVADPTLANCSTSPDAALLLPALEGVVRPAIAATLAAVGQAAPNAQVFVLGYQSLFPDAASTPAAGCFTPLGTPNSVPFTDVDVPWLHQLEGSLDAVIQSEAAAAGYDYVPTFADSTDNSTCALEGERYVNGITVVSAEPFALAPGALHPNATGIAAMTRLVTAAIEAAALPVDEPGVPAEVPGTPAEVPAVPQATPPVTAVPGSTAPGSVPRTASGELAATGGQAPHHGTTAMIAAALLAAGTVIGFSTRRRSAARRGLTPTRTQG
ncbi:SGNH/GDSL hydrolase family protein [Marisediminicola senii]|uniref:SGNH/GDSL hydrolase family protein n=1 Tax=Marisediminicola senii TaxID=2711233 RepID=UPI0013EE23DC|nr:SGNH/GDSL hydrolase family protein [Marisediminicola senii]